MRIAVLVVILANSAGHVCTPRWKIGVTVIIIAISTDSEKPFRIAPIHRITPNVGIAIPALRVRGIA
jgi:hypothetical protein